MSGSVRRVLTRAAVQTLVILGAVAAYFGVRGFTEGREDLSFRNARRLMEIQQDLGIAWEHSLQSIVIDSPRLTTIFNWIYIWGHWPVIAITLIWLVTKHPVVYARTRNAMLGSGAVGLVIYATVPMAPPRLAEAGLVDTITNQSHAYRILQPAVFTNQYAALPSLHCGWNLLMGLAILAIARQVWLRLIGVVMPVAMVAAVLLTANHYVIDVVAGMTLASLAWIIAGRWGSGAGPKLDSASDPVPDSAAEADALDATAGNSQ